MSIYREITSAKLQTGGNVIRQGAHFRQGYVPLDATGAQVDLTGKTITVTLYTKQGVRYEGPAEFDPGDGQVYYSVNENIGYGTLWAEFTVTDAALPSYRAKFPSNEQDAKMQIIRGIDDLDFAGVPGTTVAQLRSEQQDAQTAYEVTVDGKIETYVVESADLKAEFNAAMAALTVDSEVVVARGSAATLGERLDETTAQLAEAETQLADIWINVKTLGIKGDGSDETVAIQSALDTHSHLYFPKGTYKIHGTIIVGQSRSISLSNQAILEKPIESPNNEPVVWMAASTSVIKGAGMRNSHIQSKKPSPFGVVCIGYKGILDTVAKNVSYNTFSDVGVWGSQDGGESTGEPSYGVYLCNNEIDGLASYFHTIQNVFIGNANVGLMLEAYANANIINNIQFFHVGTDKKLGGAAIKLKNDAGKYPLDNIISNAFHHQSSNAVTIFLDGQIRYNIISNISSEQGGTTAVFIKNNDDSSDDNVISGLDNVSGGNDVTANFNDMNTVTSRSSFATRNITALKIKAKELTVGEGIVDKRDGFILENLLEGTAYNILKVGSLTNGIGTFTVELDVAFSSGSNIPYIWGTGKIVFQIEITSTGTAIVKQMLNYATRPLFLQPSVSGKEVTFGIYVENNGTSTTNSKCVISYRVLSNVERVITEIKTPTSSAGSRIGTHYPLVSLSGTTTARPAARMRGEQYFDTTLGKPVYWNGTAWTDAAGTVV